MPATQYKIFINSVQKELAAERLGSLLNPAKSDAAKLVQWKELSAALKQALKQEQTDEQQEAAEILEGGKMAFIQRKEKYGF